MRSAYVTLGIALLHTRRFLASAGFVGFASVVYMSGGAATAAPHQVPEAFEYQFHGNDIRPWLTGEKAGLIPDVAGGAAMGLDDLMSTARSSIKLALYGVQDQSWFIERTAQLVARGVHTTAVVDQAKGTWGDWQPHNFSYPGTPLLADVLGYDRILPDLGPTGRPRTGSIMHNKFVVVDDASLWVGSANVSNTCLGAEYNANTSLIVKSPALASVFAAEFDRMHSGRLFSVNKATVGRRPDHLIYRDGTDVRIYFSPQDRPVDEAVIPFIRSVRERLDIGIFYLTDVRVVNELIDAMRRGVRVRMIFDATAAAQRNSMHTHLRAAGAGVRVENWGGKMHMKTAVADGDSVIIGSMNWSDAGNGTNDESTLVIRGNRRLAAEVQDYFDLLWGTLDGVASTNQQPRAESLGSINSCFDGLDNDHDGLIDEADPGCR